MLLEHPTKDEIADYSVELAQKSKPPFAVRDRLRFGQAASILRLEKYQFTALAFAKTVGMYKKELLRIEKGEFDLGSHDDLILVVKICAGLRMQPSDIIQYSVDKILPRDPEAAHIKIRSIIKKYHGTSKSPTSSSVVLRKLRKTAG